MKICSVDGCEKPHLARGYCSLHYYRFMRHGGPLAGGTMRDGRTTEFINDVVLQHRDGCLYWPFGKNTHGRGMIWSDGRMVYVEHVVCARAHGPKPSPSHEVAHSCGNGHRGCVAPGHLRWATHAENMADTVKHGTSLRGSRNPSNRLSEEQVREIRRMKGRLLQREIAERYGVDRYTISEIHRGKTWAWLR